MAILGLLVFAIYLVGGYFLLRFNVRVFFGNLLDGRRTFDAPLQFTIAEVYVLILHIACAVIPVGLSKLSDGERVAWMIGITAFEVLAWIYCWRMLARARIKRPGPRVAALVAFPFQVSVAVIVPFFWPFFLLGPFAILLFPYLLALHGFASLSEWVYAQREEPERESDAATENSAATPAALPTNDAERIGP